MENLQAKRPVSILEVPVTPYTMDEAVDLLHQGVLQGKRNFVVTANAEIIMMAQEDAAYKSLLQHTADMVLPDGAGTVWAGNTLGYRVPERVAGYDLYLRLLAEAAKDQVKVFFFGGAPGVAEAAAIEGGKRWPGLQVAGCRNGYFKDSDVPGIVEEIKASGAKYLFVALGAPKQENWIAANMDSLPEVKVFMGIGGSFDVLSGRVQRAPKWMQEAKLEWFYRLAKQPSRLGRMMALPRFVLRVRQAKAKQK